MLTAVAALFTAALLPLSADAQIAVTKSGQVRVGYNVDEHDKNLSESTKFDENSSLVILGNTIGTSLSGSLAFGPGSEVLIGESPIFPNAFMIDATNGIVFRNNHKVAFSYGNLSEGLGVTSSPDFMFYCNVKAPSFLVTSDARLKKDIKPLEKVGASLLDLTPVRYRLDNTPVAMAVAEGDSTCSVEKMPFDEKERYGFLAQEVQEVYPELVSEDADGMLAIDYIGFIPLLVDEIKNLQAALSQCNEEIDALREVKGMKKTVGVGSTVADEATVLGQNRPNPFTESTTIDLTLPSDVSSAVLCIYDMQGTPVMQLPVEGRGKTAVTVDGKSLRAGMYLYSLIADGEEVATKRMILTE